MWRDKFDIRGGDNEPQPLMSRADILAVIWADMMSFFGIFTNVIEELFLFNHPPIAFLTFATTDPGREQNGACERLYPPEKLNPSGTRTGTC